MSTPQIKIHNAETGEEIIRDMTDEEIAERQAIKAKFEADKEAEKQRLKDRQAILDRLGLTEDELRIVLG